MNSSALSVMTLLAVCAVEEIILVAEGDADLVERDQPPVRDGDAVSIAREIGEHGFGAGKRRLGVDRPSLTCGPARGDAGRPAGRQVGAGGRRRPTCPRRWSAISLVRNRRRNSLPSTRTGRRNAGREDIQRSPSSEMPPPGTIMCTCGWCVSGRSPGVEHGGDADACAQVARIGGDRQHRLGRRAEQQVVDRRLVVQGDVGDLGGQSEDDVEVADRQQVGLTLGQPGARGGALALGAVPVAAANGRRPLAALWADPVMGSWRRLDRALASAAANSAHHYEGRWRSAISLSDGRNAPRRRCGGTIDSMASSFSVGSPRA